MNFQLSLLVVILLSTSSTSTIVTLTTAFVAVNHILPHWNRDIRFRTDTCCHSTTTSKESDDSNQRTIQEEWRRPELFGQSLIEQTLNDIQTTTGSTSTSTSTAEAPLIKLTNEERTAQRRSLRQATNIPNFEQHVHAMAPLSSSSSSSSPLQLLHRKSIPSILQINIGLYCNQACQHCHVESSPLRKEMMSMDVILQCLTILKQTPSITTLDITGGAPELHEHFRTLVSMARAIRPNKEDLDIIDRCNLTVLYEPNQGQDLIQFLQRHDVHVIASLPCYSEKNVNAQRGNQVFERSIAALIALNDAGFGITDLEKGDATNPSDADNNVRQYQLDLVYNPGGAFLPGPQDQLQEEYKEQLYNNFGIVFNDLFTITNMPIQRFADYLYRRNELIDYMDLLVRNYNPATIENVMCQNTISIRYDGTIYDCDFNQQLDIPILTHGGGTDSNNESRRRPLTVFDISSLDDIILQQYQKIRTDVHCFGCTAGMGSSCQGATATE